MIRFRKKAQKKTTPAEITDVIAHKKTMLPIYRKNHIKSFISRSPDLSLYTFSTFPENIFQWYAAEKQLSQ